jgi:hypothetical protein
VDDGGKCVGEADIGVAVMARTMRGQEFVCGQVLEWLVRRAEIERMPSNGPKREGDKIRLASPLVSFNQHGNTRRCSEGACVQTNCNSEIRKSQEWGREKRDPMILIHTSQLKPGLCENASIV